MKKIGELFSGDKAKTMLLLLLAVGIVLVCFPKNGVKDGSEEQPEDSSDELKEYAALLEEGLSRTIKSAVGSEEVQVFVTLDGTYENVYASDASVNEATAGDTVDRKSEKQLVLTGTQGSGQQAVTVKRLSPKVKGAVIVCRGGNDAALKKTVTDLAATVLNVPETRIYVTGGN